MDCRRDRQVHSGAMISFSRSKTPQEISDADPAGALADGDICCRVNFAVSVISASSIYYVWNA